MDEKQQNHKNSKIEHVFRDEESIRLLSQAFRGSFLERLILAILAALTIFGGFAVVAWAWHGDVSDKRLESELTQRTTLIQDAKDQIKELSDVRKSFNVEATNLRNLIDKKALICKDVKNLNNDEKLSLITEQFLARENFVSVLYNIQYSFPDLEQGIKIAEQLEDIYDENINLPCSSIRPSTDLGMHEIQVKASTLMLNEIESQRKNLNTFIEKKANILYTKLFTSDN